MKYRWGECPCKHRLFIPKAACKGCALLPNARWKRETPIGDSSNSSVCTKVKTTPKRGGLDLLMKGREERCLHFAFNRRNNKAPVASVSFLVLPNEQSFRTGKLFYPPHHARGRAVDRHIEIARVERYEKLPAVYKEMQAAPARFGKLAERVR